MLRTLLREPLLHFVILGAALFVLFKWMDAAGPGDHRIVVTPGRIAHLAAGFERTWQRPPTKQELADLLDGYVREEIYYREALALGLDKDDSIVRRRMNQKLEFLTADAAEALDPSDEELSKYLQARPEDFQTEPRATFQHVYVNPEHHKGGAKEVASQLLQRLEAGELPPEGFSALGDRLMAPMEMTLSRRSEMEAVFGEHFAESILEVERGRWTGPVESGYGLHLVYVSERRDARLPALEEVRPVVLREWLNERRENLREGFYQGLRQRYTVVVETPEAQEAGSGKAGSVVDAQ